MSTKEEILSELNSLSQAELELIAQYVTFIRHKAQIKSAAPLTDEAQLARLYAEFGEEDRELAEEGMPEYADVVSKEDHK